ncbi:GNAT family N-acetyltransferase [Dehalococcoidia bacterium]|nr:GNAT family N-acetyltransferase [Dehalococcoidia bacterium]
MEDRVVLWQATLDDRRALWEWRNDPVTLKLFNVDRAVKYADHCAWFAQTQRDKNSVLCIAAVDGLRVGSIRFDQRETGVYEVRLYLKPAHWGKDLSPQVLAKGVEFMAATRNIRKVTANFRKNDVWSKKIFEAAKFAFVEEAESKLGCELVLGDPKQASVGI